MRKAFSGLSMLILGIVFTACSSSNTKIRPMTEVRQTVEQLQTVVTRVDRSGVYLAFKNTSDKEMEMEIHQEESLAQKDVDARLQGAKDGNYIPEMTDKTLKLREDKIINKSFNQS
ncbi:hypothetical protein A2U10_02175 [Fusobacterium necrophorum subsp. funduliforme]|uniref:hypothetical protein n=1 Tax=Fusobacterium necrophorum TaxID=859 RepID=UPI000787466A|nr:hypothetical protein [Fusobacterium necrophorum]KYM40812.1 hypothetical protein A2U10_02175 [Fusobacterium necrophorum subsp. funduliforme]KYM46361.1 hypothetical protein A2U11_05775 [Fusobacterium necrophorum subsp. funduliforme]